MKNFVGVSFGEFGKGFSVLYNLLWHTVVSLLICNICFYLLVFSFVLCVLECSC